MSIPFTDSIDTYVFLSLLQTLEHAHTANGLSRALLLAVAVERYHAQTGVYPESAEALVPEYIEAIPISPATESELFYRMDAGYIIEDQDIDYYGYDGLPEYTAPIRYVRRQDEN